jgi:hypothetical protein
MRIVAGSGPKRLIWPETAFLDFIWLYQRRSPQLTTSNFVTQYPANQDYSDESGKTFRTVSAFPARQRITQNP